MNALSEGVASLFRRREGRLAPVDGLRAIAILWVISFHVLVYIGKAVRYGPDEPLFRLANRGLLGVDVFFVISGFLIGSMLMREHEKCGRIAFGRFYLRRALRILPAYWAALLLYVLLGEKNSDTAWANLLFVNNLLPQSRQAMDWTWSLAIEEQFYVVFPLVVAVGFRATERRLALFLVLFALGVAIRALVVARHGIHLPNADHARVHYDELYDKPHTRYVSLLAGVIVAYVVHFRRPVVTRIGIACAFGAALLLSIVPQPIFAWRLGPTLDFLYFTASAPLFAAAVGYLLLASLTRKSVLSRFLSWRGFYPVAQLSYSAYLLHVMIIEGGLEVDAFARAHSSLALLAAFAIVTSVVLASSLPLYLLVERPFMVLRDRIGAARARA